MQDLTCLEVTVTIKDPENGSQHRENRAWIPNACKTVTQPGLSTSKRLHEKKIKFCPC